MKIQTDWDINYSEHDHFIVDLDDEGNLFSHFIIICWLIQEAVDNPKSGLYNVVAFPTQNELATATESIRVSIGRNIYSEKGSTHHRKESEARILVRIVKKEEDFVKGFMRIRTLLNELLNLLHNYPDINNNYIIADSLWEYDSDRQVAWGDFEFSFKEHYTWKQVTVDKKANLSVDMKVD